MTTENELVKATGEPSTSDSQQLFNHDNNRQHTSSIVAIAALGAIAGLSCFMTSILLAILITQQRKRRNGKCHNYVLLYNTITDDFTIILFMILICSLVY